MSFRRWARSGGCLLALLGATLYSAPPAAAVTSCGPRSSTPCTFYDLGTEMRLGLQDAPFRLRNGRWQWTWQPDGNFVLYDRRGTLAPQSYLPRLADTMRITAFGGVSFTKQGRTVLNTGTQCRRTSRKRLVVEDNGNLVLVCGMTRAVTFRR